MVFRSWLSGQQGSTDGLTPLADILSMPLQEDGAVGRPLRLSDWWSGLESGVQTFVMDGFRVSVFPVPQEWRFSIVAIGDDGTQERQFGGPFRTQASAKLAAVKALLRRT